MKLTQLLSTTLPGLAFLIATAAPSPLTAAGIPAEGTKAPTFSLQSQEDKTVNLKDFQGQWVVLYFYPKDMTKGCTIEAHNFERDLAKYKEKKAAIVGVSADKVDSHQEFCTKESLTFKLLADPNHQVIDQYGSAREMGPVVIANRNTFLIDPKGVVRKVFTEVKPAQHSDEVLAALTELQKGSGQ
jgi:peroxiredoxin Q/BCP